MPKPESFTSSTDFATLKNDARASAQVTAPGSQVIPATIGVAASYLEYHADLAVGAPGAVMRVQIASSKNSNIIQVTQNTGGVRLGTLLGFPNPYNISAFAYRLSPTTVRCQVYIPNPNSDPLTTAAGDETFTFYINTFLPPFA